MATGFDQKLMYSLIKLAAKQKGKTSPNPVVASAVVRDGVVLAYGVHKGAGNPHAEVEALTQAGEAAKGSTLYVTLEPCTYWGKTPPCTKAIIESGISEVVYAVDDPNPSVRHHPARHILEAAGIKVRQGVLANEAQVLNEVFFKNKLAQKPFVTLKAGISLDGKIALSNFESKYITGTASLRQDHRLRREHDAMLIGSGTILADNPSLNVRFGLLKPGFKNPIKIILDLHARVQPHLNVFSHNKDTKVIVVVSQNLVGEARVKDLGKVAQLWFLPEEKGHFVWEALLNKAYAEGIFSLLIEGGRGIYTSALEAGVVDKFQFFIAPKILGGAGDIGVFAGKNHNLLSDVTQLAHVTSRKMGSDIWVTGYPQR